ncbi:MAG TPA: low affinity iron permease family protein [Thermomicrobiales bacterium]|jgi:low affinity Fe/Cu permease|nr:low affinity iron permease family protein [Thermomicrobiales bacterium]
MSSEVVTEAAARGSDLAKQQPEAVSPASELGTRTESGGVSAKFAHLANRTSILAGNYKTFIVMVGVVLLWAISGPIFKFSTTWQLVINTGTTIVTFLMVFLIQNTQNRDSLAMHLKLDEIIRAIDAADDKLMSAEDVTEEELNELKVKYQTLVEEADQLREKVGGSREVE